MSKYQGQESPDDFEPIVSRLLDKSAYTDPLELDRRKRRVLARVNSQGGRRIYMRSRIATILAVAGFAAGSGGALAIASSGSTNAQQSAAIGQYCHKKDRDDCKEHHHQHCTKQNRDRDEDHDCDRQEHHGGD
jgi:hypothetical protein